MTSSLSEADKLALEDFRKFAKDESVWVKSDEKRGVEVFTTKLPSGELAARGIGVIRRPLAAVREFIIDPSRRTEWSPFVVECRIVHTASPFDVLVYLRSKAQFPVSARDFCLRVFGEDDTVTGAVTLFGQSPDKSNKLVPPKVPGVIRAIVPLSGFYLEPISETNSTRVFYVFSVDLNGYIPKKIANYAVAAEPFSILQLRRCLTGSENP
jgi:hypothetical protein